MKTWTDFFDTANLDDLDLPVNPENLYNPSHPLVQFILYLYSMETFIYQIMNRA